MWCECSDQECASFPATRMNVSKWLVRMELTHAESSPQKLHMKLGVR